MARVGWKKWNGPTAVKIVKAGAREAVQHTLNVVMGAGKQQVPHDEGALQRSGIVVMDPHGKAQGVASFGGGPGTGHPTIPYAVRWHEQSANFQKGRKYRYLVDPFNQLAAKTLREALKMTVGRKLR